MSIAVVFASNSAQIFQSRAQNLLSTQPSMRSLETLVSWQLKQPIASYLSVLFINKPIVDLYKHVLKVTVATAINKYMNRFVPKYLSIDRLLYAKLQCLFKLVKYMRVSLYHFKSGRRRIQSYLQGLE